MTWITFRKGTLRGGTGFPGSRTVPALGLCGLELSSSNRWEMLDSEERSKREV